MAFLCPDEITYQKTGNRSKDVPTLRRMYGANTFTKKPRKSFAVQYLSAFGDPIIKILLVALALNLIIAFHNADIYEPLGIAIALFLATFVSTLSEYGSESAFLKLEEQSSKTVCRLIRDGKFCTLPAHELVSNDLLLLSGGERVPADCVIVEGSVSVDQSALNGEGAEVTKTVANTEHNWELSSKNQLFSGSVITSGECKAVVGRVGDQSLYGTVASEIQGESAKSPLTDRLSKLAGVLAKIGYLAAILVFVADLFNSVVMDNGFLLSSILAELSSFPAMTTNLLHALTLAITVVVVAVPEGLPMMITVVLSSNMQRLKRDNVLVRKLVGIETGGNINLLFCDKTGTLTCGKLSVDGYYDKTGQPSHTVSNVAALCCIASNGSKISNKKAVGGNATDRALLEFVQKSRVQINKQLTAAEKIPFDSQTKFAAAKVDGVWYIKGAPEVLIKKCNIVSPEFLKRLDTLTKSGARVIALATSRDMQSYELVGMLSVADKPRPDAKYSVRTVRRAGINVCMVTGDNIETALNIAKRCEIITSNADLAITSEQMSKMSDSELISALPQLRVVARALPSDKSRLVRLSRAAGLVCAMTGDGINDAPALKQADVGFAMGSGTEVAKQAGDIVILDDNFTSISKAILYGRTIFKSIRKFIVFQLTMNLCAVGISIIGPFIGIDTPVTVMQMLWINIIMDTLAGLAFAGEPPIAEYMTERPLARTEPVLSKGMALQICSMGVYNLILCALFLSTEFFRTRFGYYTNPLGFMTAFFALFIFSGLFSGINARSPRVNIFSHITKNKSFVVIFIAIAVVQLLLIYFGGPMFRTIPISFGALFKIILLSASVIPFEFVRKCLFNY